MSCTKTTARCANARDYRQALSPCCRGHIRDIMATVGKVLDAHGIMWWIDYGSVLGLVRNPMRGEAPGIIAHDKDGDCGILGADSEKFRRLFPALVELGLSPSWLPPKGTHLFAAGDRVKVRWSPVNQTNVDYFCWYERPNGVMYRKRYIGADQFKGREFPKHKLLPLQRAQWEGIEVWAPRQPEYFAELRYGPNWREPLAANNDGVIR